MIHDMTISFGGSRIRLVTDMQEIADFVARSHRAMLLEDAEEAARTIELLRTDAGYSFAGQPMELSAPPSAFHDLLRQTILKDFIASRPDLIWLHAGAVQMGDTAVVIAGPSGSGKSTLVTELSKLGWLYLSDEVAPIDSSSMKVLPYPRTPARREPPGRLLEAAEVLQLAASPYELDDSMIGVHPVQVRRIVFPTFSFEAPPAFATITAGEAFLHLTRNAIHTHGDTASDIRALAHLARTLSCHTLTYGNGTDAARILNEAITTLEVAVNQAEMA